VRRNASKHIVKYWEIIADNLKKAGWSLGWVSAIDSNGRTIWIADAHRDNGKRFVVRADVVRSVTERPVSAPDESPTQRSQEDRFLIASRATVS
jgi:hypothetical protein